MSVSTEAYKNWLSGGSTASALIDTLEVTHPAIITPVFLANWDVTIQANLSDLNGAPVQTFQASRFVLESSSLSDSLDQGTQISITSLDGALYEAFKNLSPEARRTPVTVTARQYLSNDLSSVVMTPPPVWYLTNIVADFDTLLGTLQAIQLRARKVGRYYVSRELPILELLY